MTAMLTIVGCEHCGHSFLQKSTVQRFCTVECRNAHNGGRPVDDNPDRGWMAAANCQGVDPDLFYPKRGEPSAEAKRVCAGCLVREVCLEHALATGEHHGIWGGVSERERRRLRRGRRIGVTG